MSILTQARFPRLWVVFQYTIGGTTDKQRLCLEGYEGQRRVLEVGCSAGNIADAFRRVDGVNYVGVDIDPAAIALAKKRFAGKANFRFVCQDFLEFVRGPERFDYILFAGVCHHMPDSQCAEMLDAASAAMAEGARLVVVDPLVPEAEDSWFLHTFVKLEQGKHLRTGKELETLLRGLRAFEVREARMRYVNATPLSFPRCARFGVYVLEKRKGSA